MSAGVPVRDDLLIMLGTTQVDHDLPRHQVDVKQAVIKLLQIELGLEIQIQGSRNAPERNIPSESNEDKMLMRNHLRLDSDTPTRRPAVIHGIKITRKSLNQWLQKRTSNRKQTSVL